MIASKQDLKRFRAAYQRLSEDGQCDSPGGAEYRRVLGEWIDAEIPEPLEPFIIEAANRRAGDPGW